MTSGPSGPASKGSLTVSLALLLILFLLPAHPASGEPLRAGFGVSPLPAPSGAPLGGYGGLRDRRATGSLDPPEARALVLEQDDLRVGLVVVDVVIARPSLRDALLEEVHGLNFDALILVATHTHSGPGGYIPGLLAERVTTGGYDPAVPGGLVRAAARALLRATEDLEPVQLGSALGRADLAENRRETDGPRETHLPVLHLKGQVSGRNRVLFSYAAHPTVLSARSRLYSADYPGAARERLASEGWDATFVPGPLGDQRPRSALGPLWQKDVATQRAQVREIGERLGAAVLSALQQVSPGPDAPLSYVERWVELPPRRLRRGCLLWWLNPIVRGSIRGFFSTRVPIHAVRIGDAVILAVPAEPTTIVGDQLRATIPAGRIPFVLSHANDWIGYSVDAERYRRGGYEACLAFHGPDLSDWLVAQAEETVRQLEERSASRPDPRGRSRAERAR